MIPGHRGSGRARGALREAQARLAMGEGIAVFPEGTVTSDPECPARADRLERLPERIWLSPCLSACTEPSNPPVT